MNKCQHYVAFSRDVAIKEGRPEPNKQENFTARGNGVPNSGERPRTIETLVYSGAADMIGKNRRGCQRKKASVRDLRYGFKKIERLLLYQGEELQITKRRRVIARRFLKATSPAP
jgi:hypothetical protein